MCVPTSHSIHPHKAHGQNGLEQQLSALLLAATAVTLQQLQAGLHQLLAVVLSFILSTWEIHANAECSFINVGEILLIINTNMCINF